MAWVVTLDPSREPLALGTAAEDDALRKLGVLPSRPLKKRPLGASATSIGAVSERAPMSASIASSTDLALPGCSGLLLAASLA